VTSTKCIKIPRGYRLLRRGETVRKGDSVSYMGRTSWAHAIVTVGSRVWNKDGRFQNPDFYGMENSWIAVRKGK
jgi:hypothetical protein